MEVEAEPFLIGSLISSRLSSNALGDLLQVHEFLCRFQEILEVGEDCLSFEDLENEILSSWPATYGVAGGVSPEIVETSFLYKVDKLTTVHMSLLPNLVSKLLCKIALAFNINSHDTENMVKTVKLDLFPINPLTWPEVARRYILACLLMGGEVNSLDTAVGDNTKLIRCLQGDDGVFTGSPTGVAGADVDAQMLARAVEKVFGEVERKRRISSPGTKFGLDSDFSIPEWAKVLDPVKKLPTNVGSRIRNCVREALKKNPPEWAKELLEASISKDIYKGNASGPTKRAVIDVLKKVLDGSRTTSPPVREEIKGSKMLSDLVMKKCRVILRQVAGHDTNRVISDLVGRNCICDGDDLKIVFGNVSRRPLDLRTIDLRLGNGTYGGSHEAFLEDVREVWINLHKTYKNRPSVIKLVDEMSNDFKLRNEEVRALYKRFYEQNMNGESVENIEKDFEELLTSIEIPKVPWDTGICKVCGLNRDDSSVLLCDTEGCNAEYHTYCLTPPLSEIPNGNWFCPTCAPPKWDNEQEVLLNALQLVDETGEETVQFLDVVTALEKQEYWELDPEKKTFLLKFLCDELLKTRLIRTEVNPEVPNPHEVMREKRGLKSKEENLVAENDNDSVDNNDDQISHMHPKKEAKKLNLRKEFLGIDSDNRFYWGFPNTSTHHGIVVNEGKNGNSGVWYLFQSNEQIKNLLDYLKRNDAERKDLQNSISKWQKSISKDSQEMVTNLVEGKTVFSRNGIATKASELLDAKYNTELDSSTLIKPRRKNMAKWHRCECLEPVLPCRYHCVKCHETFFTNVEFEQHKNCDCGFSESKLIVEKGSDEIRQLKINLLDMEAVLPNEAKRGSRGSSEWRSAWCAFVKSANSIFEMVEATLVFETMIKTEYIKNTWWWYWCSVAAAAKTSTISAIALRIYTLDAAIDYQKTTTDAASSGKKF